MKLEVAMLVGPESKQFLLGLTEQIDRLEKLASGAVIVAGATKAQVAQAPAQTEDDDFSAKPKPQAAKGSSFDDETPAQEDMDFMAPPAAKKEKAKKVTVEDVNDACKAKATATNRKTVLALLKDQFGVDTISALTAEQYPKVIQAMKA